MFRLSVVLPCLFFTLIGMSPAHAFVQEAGRVITLPLYNPERMRIPNTPEAQKLHKKILVVSRNLKILKAVPLDDPSVDGRLKKIIAKKIQGIETKLGLLKRDMDQRLKANAVKAKKVAPSPTPKVAPKLQKEGALQPVPNKQSPVKKKDFSQDVGEEIKRLKQTLGEVSRKLAALERRQALPKRALIMKPIEVPTTPKSPKQKMAFFKKDDAQTIPLPVKKIFLASPPKIVRTSVIYPSLESHRSIEAFKIFPPLPQWKPRNALQDGVYLPFAKPGFWEKEQAGRDRKKLWPQKQPKKYASVEDVSGLESHWSETSVIKGRVQCAKLFAKLNISFIEKAPIKKGLCGTPAPIMFKGFGTDSRVQISPAATINCQTAAVVARWMNNKVQPLALKLFGQPVTKIHNVSSYNCRNRYGRKNGKISEHAYANALDVMAFTLKSGEKIDLLKDFYSEDKKGEFLHKIHALACQDKFGTVLGPDANAAHKNHFHLDLAKRRHSAYCE